MDESIRFHAELYAREALETAAQRSRGGLRVELTEIGADIVARLVATAGDSPAAARADFCNEALSETLRRLHETRPATSNGKRLTAAGNAPPWGLLLPFSEGAAFGDGWVVESLSPIQSGSAVLVLRHRGGTTARVSIWRNDGVPRGVAHTEHLDFLLMNGGGGSAQTDESIETALSHLADVVQRNANGAPARDLLGHSYRTAKPTR